MQAPEDGVEVVEGRIGHTLLEVGVLEADQDLLDTSLSVVRSTITLYL